MSRLSRNWAGRIQSRHTFRHGKECAGSSSRVICRSRKECRLGREECAGKRRHRARGLFEERGICTSWHFCSEFGWYTRCEAAS